MEVTEFPLILYGKDNDQQLFMVEERPRAT